MAQRRRNHPVDPSKLMKNLPPNSRAAEAYRALRINLQFLSRGAPLQTILVTSASPGVGKSTTAANLAISFAQTGKATILVDADLRHPVQHMQLIDSVVRGVRLNGSARGPGLSRYLAGMASRRDCLKPVPGVDNLFLLPSGPVPPNPTELVSGPAMHKLLFEATADFEYIIIDSPPILAVTDAVTMATMVDGTLLVVSENCHRHHVEKAVKTLSRVNAGILGAVLNGVSAHQGGYVPSENKPRKAEDSSAG